jgi:biopolymer transport protein ExbB
MLLANPVLANIVTDTFIKGGPVMWPILVTFLASLTVTSERFIWWFRTRSKSEPEKIESIYEALESGEVKKASTLARNSHDPIVRVIWHGLNHRHTSLENALQVAAGLEIERAGRFLTVLDTIITLAPLLGLLGTVTGIMHAFHFVGDEEVAAVKVSGGIAEALIATAAGLTIAILTLLPFNYFNSAVHRFTFRLQTAATNIEVLLKGATTKKSSSDETAYSSAS